MKENNKKLWFFKTRAPSFISIYGNLNKRPASTPEFEYVPSLSTIFFTLGWALIQGGA